MGRVLHHFHVADVNGQNGSLTVTYHYRGRNAGTTDIKITDTKKGVVSFSLVTVNDACNKQTFFVLFFVKLFVHFARQFRGSFVPVYC